MPISSRAAVALIHDYVRDYLFEPRYTWAIYDFKERSYARWVAAELAVRIMKRQDISPIEIVDDFRDRMDTYIGVVESEDGRMFLSIAYDAAGEIRHLLSNPFTLAPLYDYFYHD